VQLVYSKEKRHNYLFIIWLYCLTVMKFVFGLLLIFYVYFFNLMWGWWFFFLCEVVRVSGWKGLCLWKVCWWWQVCVPELYVWTTHYERKYLPSILFMDWIFLWMRKTFIILSFSHWYYFGCVCVGVLKNFENVWRTY
jgi:hypothetical protein